MYMYMHVYIYMYLHMYTYQYIHVHGGVYNVCCFRTCTIETFPLGPRGTLMGPLGFNWPGPHGSLGQTLMGRALQ